MCVVCVVYVLCMCIVYVYCACVVQDSVICVLCGVGGEYVSVYV